MENSMENKRDLLTEKIMVREQLRQQEIMRKRVEKESTQAESEKVENFRTMLAEKSCKIGENLNSLMLNSDNKADLPEQFDNINKDITSLQRYVAASTLFLTAYDVRRAQERIQEVEQKFRKFESQLMPKKKFSFKSRKPVDKKQGQDTTDKSQCSKSQTELDKIRIQNLYIDHSLGFANKKGENLKLSHEEMFQNDVTLTSLEDCTVILMGSASTLHIMSLKNCKVLSGPVATSIFIANCTDCVFQLACQQLRIHETKMCDFYLHVKSRAIIEDTSRVRFAPFNWNYDEMELHFEVAGLEMNTNHWDSIDDFNWLAIDKPSPNWQILNEVERITDWKIYEN